MIDISIHPLSSFDTTQGTAGPFVSGQEYITTLSTTPFSATWNWSFS